MDKRIMINKITNRICKQEKIAPIKLYFKNTRRGRARINTRKITIPLWALGSGVKKYYVYYIIHELCHFIAYDNFNLYGGHGVIFKGIEQRIAKNYGIKIVYARAYAKQLKDNNGQVLCNGLGLPVSTKGA